MQNTEQNDIFYIIAPLLILFKSYKPCNDFLNLCNVDALN